MAERRAKRPIGELLVGEGLITQGQLLEALASRSVVDGKRERIGETLTRLGFVQPSQIARAIAQQHGLEFADADLPMPHAGAAEAVPEQLARRHRIVPLWTEVDGTLVVLTADPSDIVAMDDVRLSAGARRIRPIVTPPGRIGDALKLVYLSDGSRTGDLLDQITAEAPAEPDDAGAADAEATGPVIRLAEQIIHDALVGAASDIHVEPGPMSSRVRYRIDGVLHEVMTLPRKVHAPLVSRLKLIAALDIAERRRPQDGRSTYRSRTEEADIRVSTLPVLHGEKIVMRLLRKGAEALRLHEVGLSVQQHADVLAQIERPQGLVLLTGPTGAGKTSTLYAFLEHLSDEGSNLITIEDPIEYELPGVNQTQVQPRIGWTFSTALRTVLRQDPDIVMVGEVRDLETAELAMQASLTGHMVFSTLHTNDAPGAVTRLVDLGIPAYLIASSLTMVIAQRLGRRVCRTCATPHVPTPREIQRLHLDEDDLARDSWVVGRGCSACQQTGYRGRIAFIEILVVDAGVRAVLVDGADEQELRRAARGAGLRSLREDGLAKAREGITSLEEVLRVTPTDSLVEEEAVRAGLAAAPTSDAGVPRPEPTPRWAPTVLDPRPADVPEPEEQDRAVLQPAMASPGEAPFAAPGAGARTYSVLRDPSGRSLRPETPVLLPDPADA